MKLCKKRSEYQVAYKKPNATLVQLLYEEGAKFRNKKRNHNLSCQFSLKWDSEEEEDDDKDCNPKNSNPTQSKRKTALYEYSYVKQTVGKDEKEIKTNKHKTRCGGDKIITQRVKYCSSVLSNVDHGDSSSEHSISISRNSKCSRPFSSRGRNSVRSETATPFAMYGSGNRSQSVGEKKSHNVRSCQNTVVKTSKKIKTKTCQKSSKSLIEFTNKENRKVENSDRKNCRKNSKSVSQIEKIFSCQFSLKKKKSDTSDWMTEYTRCFSRMTVDDGRLRFKQT